MESEVIFLRKEQRAAVYGDIILNRPEKGNALNRQMLEQLDSIVSQIESDRELRAVVIRARGRFFCTGGDIDAWSSLSPNDMGRDWILYGIQVFGRLAALPQPVIAAVSGHALGGGCQRRNKITAVPPVLLLK
jgi:enoyl-CoA hydratase/carnithine racemase